MATVTGRIKEIKQPQGGYIKPSKFSTTIIDDRKELNPKENVHGIIIGIAVDYLTRFLMGSDVYEAFKISMKGALIAEKYEGVKNAKFIAYELIDGITGLNKESIINACKLVTFDVWYRNLPWAFRAKTYRDTNPDKETIENIKILIKRCKTFFKKYGPITQDGFDFYPEEKNHEIYENMILSGNGSYGGYTATVTNGDGDFLTADTLWDLKVSKSKPTNKNTLQLLMYWIMGQHSDQEIYKNITKIGIFNPRLNTVFLHDINDIPESVIKAVEKEVICYDEI